jgi:hypothetical protein
MEFFLMGWLVRLELESYEIAVVTMKTAQLESKITAD